MSVIHVDYTNARAQARKLDQAANECADIVRNLTTTLNIVSSYWSGDAAEAYKAEIRNEINRLKSTQSELQSVASTIRKVVEDLEEAERKALEKINSLPG